MKSSKVLMVMVMVLNTPKMVVVEEVVVVVWMKEMEMNKLVMRV